MPKPVLSLRMFGVFSAGDRSIWTQKLLDVLHAVHTRRSFNSVAKECNKLTNTVVYITSCVCVCEGGVLSVMLPPLSDALRGLAAAYMWSGAGQLIQHVAAWQWRHTNAQTHTQSVPPWSHPDPPSTLPGLYAVFTLTHFLSSLFHLFIIYLSFLFPLGLTSLLPHHSLTSCLSFPLSLCLQQLKNTTSVL